MARWTCRCGNELVSGEADPDPQAWHLIPDTNLDEVGPNVRLTTDADIWHFRRLSGTAHVCDSCGRVYVFPSKRKFWSPLVYVPEPQGDDGA